MPIGPFQPSDKIRIPLEVTLNGRAIAISNPRVQRLIGPSGADLSGFPMTMTALKTGTYMLELILTTLGNYTAILQGELGNDTIEEIETFVIEKPFGLPRIEIATDE